METKKWEVADYIDKITGARSLAVWEGQQPICLVSPKGTETEQDWDNANLIAAAPKLLEALINLVEAVPKQTNDADWWEDNLTDAVEKANELINNYYKF